jgi:xanthosine utilization system XapX-like protein
MNTRLPVLRLSLCLVISTVMLAMTANGVTAQDETLSATGTFSGEQRNAGGYDLTMSGPIQLAFPSSGGSVSGMLAAEIVRAGDGTVLEHFFNLALGGTFDGFPGGEMGGPMSGLFTDKHIADRLYELQLLVCAFEAGGSESPDDPDCIDPAPDYDAHTLEVSGSWHGRLDQSGIASGTFEILVPAYSVGDETFAAMEISGTWEIAGFPVGEIPLLALPSIVEFIPGAVPLLSETSFPASQIPGIALVGILGALAGVWVAQALMRIAASPSAAATRKESVREKWRKARARRIRAKRIRKQSAWQQQDPQKHQDEIERHKDGITMLRTTDFIADRAMSTAAHFVPVAGPAIETAYDEIKMIAALELTAYDQSARTGLQEYTRQRFYFEFRDRFRNPARSSSDDMMTAPDQAPDEDQEAVIDVGLQAVNDRGMQLITGHPG